MYPVRASCLRLAQIGQQRKIPSPGLCLQLTKAKQWKWRHLIRGILVVGGQEEWHFAAGEDGEWWHVHNISDENCTLSRLSEGPDDLFFTTTNTHHNRQRKSSVPPKKHTNLIFPFCKIKNNICLQLHYMVLQDISVCGKANTHIRGRVLSLLEARSKHF